ncbi:MAG: hypothetical protein IJ446_03480, partial [Oscillospiraceae bacterium]|nr:hypothetical protein [Oscillospiraceae bacterium]
MYYIVDESSKQIIEKEFSDCIQFLDVINDDDPLTNYYLLYPYKSIEGLDIDKSKCSFRKGETAYSDVYKFVFKKNIEYCPIFKMRCGNTVYKLMVMATDKFKNFIESNNITGFDFEEVFDFDEAFSSETEKTTDNITEQKCTVNNNRNSNKAYNIPIEYSDGNQNNRRNIMKIYRLHTEENGIWCLYSESNKFNCLDFLDHYSSDMDEDKRFDNCEPLYFYMNSPINKRQKEYNIMYYNLMFLIVDKSTKVALEYNFSDSIQFIETINEDDSSKEYYFLNPFRSIDGLDLNKSEYSCMPKSRIPSMIKKYVFKKDVSYYPIFKLNYGGAVYSTKMFATDEFKDFIESNGITGLVFEEVFDFDKAFSSETEKTTDNITEQKCTVNNNRNSNKAYNIPIKYSDGKYLLSKIKNDQGENFIMELDNCGMLTNNKNNYIVYDLNVEDIPQNTEI